MSEQRHLKRLSHVWHEDPVYFVTTCVADRLPLLAHEPIHKIVRDEFRTMKERHGWSIGSYVVMPDHVHFFAKPIAGHAKPLSLTIGKWKEWTAKHILRNSEIEAPLWQPEFFDHILRSTESRSQKWDYMIENPVRAGLVSKSEDWPYKGKIDF